MQWSRKACARPAPRSRSAQRHGIELPIAAQMAAVLDGRRTPREAVEALMLRPQRQRSLTNFVRCRARTAREAIAGPDSTERTSRLQDMGFFDKIKQSLTRTKEQFVDRFDEAARRADAPDARRGRSTSTPSRRSKRR